MSSTVTSWSPDTNTNASETTSATLNNATLSGTLTVTGATALSSTLAVTGATALSSTLTVTGATQLNSTLTVGVDDTGYDVKLFGDTASKYWLWDTSADGVVLVGASTQTGNSTITGNLTVSGTLTLGSGAELAEAELEMLDGITAGTVIASKAIVTDSNIDITGGRNITISGELDAATLDISGNVDIDGTTNLDAVDIDGAVQLDGTLTVGVNDTGYNVKFFGADSGKYWLWNQSGAILDMIGDFLQTGNHYVVGASTMIGALTVGVDNTGHDVKFFGATSGRYMLWDESADALKFTDNSGATFGTDVDMAINHTGSNGYITNTTGGLFIATTDSGIAVSIGHATSETTVNDNLTVTGDLTLSSNVIKASDGGSTITLDTSDNVTIAGNLTAGTLVAKTYRQETFYAINTAATSALVSGTEYFMPIGGNPQDNVNVISNSPVAHNVQTAVSDFTIERLAINFYNGQSNVTSIEVRLKKYDGSGNMDASGEWATVGTVATIFDDATLAADTRVVQTPTDWVIEKNEIWGLTIEYTLSSGTVTDNLINGAVLMLQDWSDIIANT